MKLRPTWSEPLASPFGCLSLPEASSSLAVFAAPHATTTSSPAKVSVSPSRSTTTPVTAVAVGAAHTGAVGRVLLVEQDPAGGVEGVVAGGFELIGELLDPRLVRHGRVRVRRAGRRLRWILAPCSVHLVELLGLRVVGLQLVVRDRPGRRDAVVVTELAEVLRAQPVERGA